MCEYTHSLLLDFIVSLIQSPFNLHMAIKAETPILWPPHAKNWLFGKDPDAGRDWGQEEKGTTEDWDGWMASPTRWTWVWVNSWSGWWKGRPGMLQSMGSQIVRHDWATKMNWPDPFRNIYPYISFTWIRPSVLALFLDTMTTNDLEALCKEEVKDKKEL